MRNALSGITILSSVVLLGGCAVYRPEPLKPSVEMTALRERTPHTVALNNIAKTADSPEGVYDSSDGLNEAEMVMVALSFNPELRNRRHEISRIGTPDLFGMIRFKPEMRVNLNQATVGVATDTDMLYTLLMPNLRQAWRNDESARLAQSRAEMLAAEAKLVLEVRSSHVKLLAEEKRLAYSSELVRHREQLYHSLVNDPKSPVLDRSLALIAWQQSNDNFRVHLGVVDESRRDLNRLMGFDPATEFTLTASNLPLVKDVHQAMSIEEIDQQLINGRWELKIQEALYQRAEFTYSQALMNQYPKLRLGPAVTYDREAGTSFRLGASLRIPWPDDAAKRAEDASIERDRARASYISKLHELRSDAHRAHARLVRSIDDLNALNDNRATAHVAKQMADKNRADGTLSLCDYLPLIERCEALEWKWLDAALGYRLADINLDHATGRLNQYAHVPKEDKAAEKPQP